MGEATPVRLTLTSRGDLPARPIWFLLASR